MLKKRTVVTTVAAIFSILVFTCSAFSQMNGPQGMGGGMNTGGQGMQGMGQDPMVTGEVVSIAQNSVTVTTQTGETKQVATTSDTSYVKQTTVDKSALVKGGSVLVMGEPFGQNAVTPMVVIILDKMVSMPGPRGQGGQRMQGPVIGTITATDPLTIQQASGETTVAQLTENTRIFKETSINPADIAKGTRVRIIAPQRPGSTSREARKVIVLL